MENATAYGLGESPTGLPCYIRPEDCMAKLLYLVALEIEEEAIDAASRKARSPYAYNFHPDIFHKGEKAIAISEKGKGQVSLSISHNIASEMAIFPEEVRLHYARRLENDLYDLLERVMEYCSAMSADELMAIHTGSPAEAISEIRSIISADPKSERALRDFYNYLSRASCQILVQGEIEPDCSMRLLLGMRDWANPELLEESDHTLHESSFGPGELASRLHENRPRPHTEILSAMAAEFVREARERMSEDNGPSPGM